MKYIKIVNILVIVMMLTTVLIPAVEATANYEIANYEITVVGEQFIMIDYINQLPPIEFWFRSDVTVDINGIRKYDQTHLISYPYHVETTLLYTGVIDTIHVSVGDFVRPISPHPNPLSHIYSPQIVYADIYRNGVFLEREHFTPPIPTNLSHALNFTLASAMLLPTMTIGKVDDIMLIIGRFIDCGITKFTIRAALLKAAAKGVAIVTAITAVGYLFSHFADDIYYAIFTTVPTVQPGDTYFHKDDLPQIMGIIHSYFPTKPHITKAIEQAIRLHIDAYGMISIAEVMTIVKHKQDGIVRDIYRETPEILPENIPVHKDKIDDVMKIIDGYFPVETPIRNIIEEEILRYINEDIAHNIPIEEIYEYIEKYQDIDIDIPPAFPGYVNEQNLPDIMDLIDEYYPIEIPIRNIIEEEILRYINEDIAHEIPIEEVYEYIEQYQDIDIGELPPAFPGYVNEDNLPEVIELIDDHFPIEIPIKNIIEEEIKNQIIHDYPNEIPSEEVVEIIEREQGIDIPPVYPPYVNEGNLPEIIELIDDYFPIEIPIKNIIEEEIKDQIIHDYPNEIPFEEVVEIIEEEQNIYIPEIPVETPQQYEEYIKDLINYQDYKDEVCKQVQEEEQLRDEILYTIIYDQTPCLFREIPETPIKPKEPQRPKEHLHTFPFYSIFVDPIASVIGIKLAHLFAAMMVIGCIISIASSWGVIGAILGGFIGTFMTSYFGLTSWLIPLYLVIVFIIYLNIKIRKGSDVR